MSKIGIVTFQRAHNYGAVLQCFALQETIKKLGHNPIVLDHINPIIKKIYIDGSLKWEGNLFNRFKQLVKYILIGKRINKRYNAFDNFINSRLNLSTNNHNDYDKVIYGSDQIWNDNITYGDSFYWGENIEDYKKIGYAVSAGNFESHIYKHLDSIKRFQAIGVREDSLTNTLRNLNIHNVSTVLDPTLLLDKKDWIKTLMLKETEKEKKYLLVYPLRERERTLKFAQEIARQKNLQIIEIGTKINPIPYKKIIDTADPSKFVNLIRNAAFVVTNSFHGTVFSIIFNRPFITINLQDGSDGRVENILDILDLKQNHLCLDGKYNPNNIGEYNTDRVNKLLKNQRVQSLKFLSSNLSNL